MEKEEFKYYLDHQSELLKQYNGKYLMIIKKQVGSAQLHETKKSSLAVALLFVVSKERDHSKGKTACAITFLSLLFRQ